MRIKDLEKAELLPQKESIRTKHYKERWDAKYCDRYYFGHENWVWFNHFLDSCVGLSTDRILSLLNTKMSEKHLSEYHKHICLYEIEWRMNNKPKRWYNMNEYYSDDNGIFRKHLRKPIKSNDLIINYGEPIVRYYVKDKYRKLFNLLVIVFGYNNAIDMYENGITQNQYCCNSPLMNDTNIMRFNNLCVENKVFSCWTNIWEYEEKYPYTVIYKYKSDEYKRYHSDNMKIQRKNLKLDKLIAIDKFNNIERKIHFNDAILI